MMQQSIGRVCRCRFLMLSQVNKVGHGGDVLQVRQGSSTSSWDVGNPPTNEKHPGQGKAKQEEKDSPSGRPEKVQTPSLEKEYSARDLFHDKARETEERLSQEGKVPETQGSKK